MLLRSLVLLAPYCGQLVHSRAHHDSCAARNCDFLPGSARRAAPAVGSSSAHVVAPHRSMLFTHHPSSCFVLPGWETASARLTPIASQRKDSRGGVDSAGPSKPGKTPRKHQTPNAVTPSRESDRRKSDYHGNSLGNTRGRGNYGPVRDRGFNDHGPEYNSASYNNGNKGHHINYRGSRGTYKGDTRNFNEGLVHTNEDRRRDNYGPRKGRNAANDLKGYTKNGAAKKNSGLDYASRIGFGRDIDFAHGSAIHGKDRWLTKGPSRAGGGAANLPDSYGRDSYVNPQAQFDDYPHSKRAGAKSGKRDLHAHTDNPRRGTTYGKPSPRGKDKDRTQKYTTGFWPERTHEEIAAEIARFNRRLAQENQQAMRVTTERLNPLLKLVSHSNQKNQKLRISPELQQKLATKDNKTKGVPEGGNGKGAFNTTAQGPKGGKNPKRATNGRTEKKQLQTMPQQKNQLKQAPTPKRLLPVGQGDDDTPRSDHGSGEHSDTDTAAYCKALDLSASELNSMSIDVPGIRLLEPSSGLAKGTPSGKSLTAKLDQLKAAGFDGIVDMNSLFSVSPSVFQEPGSPSRPGEATGADFSSLGIRNPGLIKALEKKGITKATNTQTRHIPAITSFLSDNQGDYEPLRCMSIHAPTGSGKTLAYLLPLLQRILRVESPTGTRESRAFASEKDAVGFVNSLFNENVVVLTPSVELSVQSHLVLKELYQTYREVVSDDTPAPPSPSTPAKPAPAGASSLFRAIGAKLLGRLTGPKAATNDALSIETTDAHTGNTTTFAPDDSDPGPSPCNGSPRFTVVADIKPVLLIGNANVANQKRALKELRAQQLESRRSALATIRGLYSAGKSDSTGPTTPIQLRRVVGFMFTTPGRAYSLWQTHKALDLQGTKYCVVDEYDGFLQLKRATSPDTDDTKIEIENPQTKEVLDAMLMGRRAAQEPPGVPSVGPSPSADRTGKYVLCLSASKLKDAPSCFGRLAAVSQGRTPTVVTTSGGVTSHDSSENDNFTTTPDAETGPPRNILHTMALYSVADAKLALLRKVLHAFPYEKSALVFCDSNGTAQFLESYLRSKLPTVDVTVLNCRQGRLERKRSFQSVLQSNLSGAVQAQGRKRKGGSTPVRSVVISTQLNSRGIDFSGFSHVIHYDLPHGRRPFTPLTPAQT
ncbi:DEAD/DEAH box helicase domain-containing protein [Babesia caballi]|uniref:ATP-dependent RNA helicase n=1 Tax=Babesia caballi TaxID=5871 RepID=A0AAV4M268_BABCB|nr:DEAD/DEAH box helicase domain-containing protein [Babesia caballi]